MISISSQTTSQVINWAVGPEGISLAEGREIFGGRTVLSGFENGKNGLLYTGDKAAIQAETKRIIAETGTTGLVIGADCTIQVTLMKSESNGFVKLQQNKKNRIRENRVWVKKTWIIGGVAVLAIAGATILGRSLNHANDSKGSTGSNKVTTLKVAHTQNYVPYDFVDEKENQMVMK